MSDGTGTIYADAGDFGLRFVFPAKSEDLKEIGDFSAGGLRKDATEGHFITIVGRGGTAKSMLALQFCINLLENYQSGHCFYFTLEATREDLESHIATIQGSRPEEGADTTAQVDRLHITTLSSPVDSLLSLNHSVQKTIAEELRQLDGEEPTYPLCAVVDPLGGIELGPDLRRDLSHLRELVRRHRMFLFLLCEDHVFREHPVVEHYSQTVLHIEHDPASRPDRVLYVQKSRLQPFWPGRHHLEIIEFGEPHQRGGVEIYPSMEAVSAFAHELKDAKPGDQPPPATAEPAAPEPPNNVLAPLNALFQVDEPGSVFFLMGPPGTMKQEIARAFYDREGSEQSKGDILYLSFKAEKPGEIQSQGFIDARNPLWTPERALSDLLRKLFPQSGRTESFQRAVIWGLRRLSDMPNFDGGKDVLFLEIVVTLLQNRKITSLLVDWPDLDRRSALPIVDLCQHILLTRICKRREEFKKSAGEQLAFVWGDDDRRRAVLVRSQRSDLGFHRDRGCLLVKPGTGGTEVEAIKIKAAEFERYWVETGYRWEEDPALFDIGARPA